MKKIFGLIILFLCLTLFIWANFIVTDENTIKVEKINADNEETMKMSYTAEDNKDIFSEAEGISEVSKTINAYELMKANMEDTGREDEIR